MVPPTVTLCSCIASSRADCVLGVARLISSASTIWAKIGPGWKLKTRLPSRRLADDVGADDVRRHQVGRELDAVELQVEHLAERAHQQRLAQAGHAFEQGVAADEQAGQDAVDDVGVADDDLADLAVDPAVGLAELAGRTLLASNSLGDMFTLRCSRAVTFSLGHGVLPGPRLSSALERRLASSARFSFRFSGRAPAGGVTRLRRGPFRAGRRRLRPAAAVCPAAVVSAGSKRRAPRRRSNVSSTWAFRLLRRSRNSGAGVPANTARRRSRSHIAGRSGRLPWDPRRCAALPRRKTAVRRPRATASTRSPASFATAPARCGGRPRPQSRPARASRRCRRRLAAGHRPKSFQQGSVALHVGKLRRVRDGHARADAVTSSLRPLPCRPSSLVFTVHRAWALTKYEPASSALNSAS